MLEPRDCRWKGCENWADPLDKGYLDRACDEHYAILDARDWLNATERYYAKIDPSDEMMLSHFGALLEKARAAYEKARDEYERQATA